MLGGCAVLLTMSCASSPPPQAPVTEPPNAKAAVEPVRLEDRRWGVVRSPALGLKLALPEARAWLPEPRPGGTWELRHEPTGTSLTVRRWRSSRLPSVESCEAELSARALGLSTPDETNLVSRRRVRIPEGFTTRVTLLALPGKNTRVAGEVLAVSAGVGECIAVIARTECTTEAELGERLRLLDVSVRHLRTLRIEDRVPAPAPVGAP